MRKIMCSMYILTCMIAHANGAILQIGTCNPFPDRIDLECLKNSDSLIKEGVYDICFKNIKKIHGGYLFRGYIKGFKPKIELLLVSPDSEEDGEAIILNKTYRIRISPYFDTDCSTNFEHPGMYNISLGENVLWIPCEGDFRYIFCSENLIAQTVVPTLSQTVIDTNQIMNLANNFIVGVLNNSLFDSNCIDISAIKQTYLEYGQGCRFVSYRKKHVITKWCYSQKNWSCPDSELVEREFLESCYLQLVNIDTLPNSYTIKDVRVIYNTKETIDVNVKYEIQDKEIETVFSISTKDKEYRITGVCYPNIKYVTTQSDRFDY